MRRIISTVVAHKRKLPLVLLVFIFLYSYYHLYPPQSDAKVNIPSVDKTPEHEVWVLQSWMEYPHPISFPSSPSLLNEANPNPLNILIVNYHDGVENEIHAVLEAAFAPLHQTVNFHHTRGVGDITDFTVTEGASREYYPLHTDHCNSSVYDLIVVGDVITYGRPYLQAECKTNIILFITNRFDFGIWGDSEWAALVESASRWPNVRVIVDNLHEHNYALTSRNVDIHIYAYAPCTGMISDTAKNMLATSEIDWSTVDKTELLLLDRGGQTHLLDLLREKNIPGPFVMSHYGGPLDVAGRFMIHIPYQVNTLALFENLNVGVLWVLPSVRLYRRWLVDGTFRMDSGERGERNWTEKELTAYADWYRDDLSHLFFYFEELEDLAPGSRFREKLVKEADAKKKVVEKYMKHQLSRTKEAWRQALSSFPRLSEAKPLARNYPLGLPPVAVLPPFTPT